MIITCSANGIKKNLSAKYYGFYSIFYARENKGLPGDHFIGCDCSTVFIQLFNVCFSWIKSMPSLRDFKYSNFRAPIIEKIKFIGDAVIKLQEINDEGS